MEEQSVDAPGFDDGATYDEVVGSLINQISALTLDLHVANIRVEKLKARNAELEKLLTTQPGQGGESTPERE